MSTPTDRRDPPLLSSATVLRVEEERCHVADQDFTPGTRAYLSAGFPDAEWWVAGPAVALGPAAVELDQVEELYRRHGLWASVLG